MFARLIAVVRRIPRGRVATYGQVAALAGLPRYARHVGYALSALPDGSGLPWHRVLGAGGAIRVRSIGSAETQVLRLTGERIAFGARGRVDLERFGWHPTLRLRAALGKSARRAASLAERPAPAGLPPAAPGAWLASGRSRPGRRLAPPRPLR